MEYSRRYIYDYSVLYLYVWVWTVLQDYIIYELKYRLYDIQFIYTMPNC